MTKLVQARAGAAFGFAALARFATRALVAWCRRCAERRRQRLSLATLDDHTLRDIGLTPGQALFESRKPFWRP